jgi:cysteine synthase A
MREQKSWYYSSYNFNNKGGSIKDRPAKQMILDAINNGNLKPGMTIVEGTAGNTGIGLSLAARELGYKMLVVMPDDQAKEKEREVLSYGAELKIVPSVPFKDENHFYHTARKIAENDPANFWFANQFENLSNFKAHYTGTGPEIYDQLNGKVDVLVSAAGTGGTIAGTSAYLKEKIPQIKVYLVDPDGSGLHSYINTNEFKSNGSSITEGIGIMRLVPNFRQALERKTIDGSFNLPDRDLVIIANHCREKDDLFLGSSSSINVAGAFKVAMAMKSKGEEGRNIVTFLCDGGERALSKLYNPEFLKSKNLFDLRESISDLAQKYSK